MKATNLPVNNRSNSAAKPLWSSSPTVLNAIKNHKHLLFLVLVFGLAVLKPLEAKPKKPDWVINYGSSGKYPADRFLVGFGSCIGVSNESREVAQDNARADLARSILVNIDSIIGSQTIEDGRYFSQEFSSVTQSSTSLRLMGLKTEVFVENNRKNETTYSLAYARRSQLNRVYGQERRKLQVQIRELAELAETNHARKELAIKYYFQTLPLFEKLQEVETVLMSVSANLSLDALNFDDSGDQDTVYSKSQIQGKIDRLILYEIDNFTDVVRSIQFQFEQQFAVAEGHILVKPFSYQETKVTSQFAKHLKHQLESQITNSVPQARYFQAKSAEVTRELAVASGADYLVNGSYWEREEQIQISSALRNIQTSTVVASANVAFDRKILPKNLDLTPPNLEIALAQQQAFASDQIQSRQLQLEIWTNKGAEDLIFSQREEMQIYIRVNRPSYVRLLYILADGTKTLLLDAFRLGRSKVNRVASVNELLGVVFECSAPFGAEMLVAIARTEPFNPIDTVEIDGYFFIQSDDFEEVATLVRDKRGFEKGKINNSEVKQSESRIMITTVPTDL